MDSSGATKKSDKANEVFTIHQNGDLKATPAENTFCGINRKMLKLKLHFLVFSGGLSFVLPYTSLYARDVIGISATALGAIATVQQFIIIFSKPFICYLADYFNKLKVMIASLIILQATFFFLLLAVPRIEVRIDNNNNKGNAKTYELYDPCIADAELFLADVYDEKLENICILDFSGSSDERHLKMANSYKPSASLDAEMGRLNHSYENKSSLKLPDENNISKFYFVHVTSLESSRNMSSLCYFFDIFPALNRCEITGNMSAMVLLFNRIMFGYIFEENLGTKLNLEALNSSEIQSCDDDSEFQGFLMKLENSAVTLHKISYSQYSKNYLASQNQTLSSHQSILSIFQTYQFWIFALVFTCANISVNALFTISDTACFESIRGTGHDFGRQRLFGAIGWGSMAPVAGYIIDLTHSYASAWIAATIFFAITLLNLRNMELVKPFFSKNILKDVGSVLKTREFLSFLLGVFFNGIGIGVIWMYLLWFVTSIGGSRLLCGLMQLVQCALGQIPFLFFSGWVIKKIGHFPVLTLSLIAYCLRFMWYSYLQNPWLILVSEVLHGFNQGLFYATVASYAALSAKPGTEATTQAVLFGTYEGLGAGTGCVLAGISFDLFGVHWTFFYLSIIAGIGMIIHTVNTLIIRRHGRKMKISADTHLPAKTNGKA